MKLRFWLCSFSFLLTFGAHAQISPPADASAPIVDAYVAGPLVQKPYVLYLPALPIKLRMEATAWVVCTAAPDGTVTDANFERLDSVVLHYPDSMEMAKSGDRARAQFATEAVKMVRTVVFVAAPAARRYRVPVRYYTGGTWEKPVVRRPYVGPRHTKPVRKPVVKGQ